VRTPLAVAAAGELGTGVLLLVYPPLVVRLLLGAEIADVGIVMGRVAGMGLVGLGLACWPGGDATGRKRAWAGMLTYTGLVTLYLAYLGVARQAAGILLWPAVGFHLLMAYLLVRGLGKA
jgi:hypothetical protein